MNDYQLTQEAILHYEVKSSWWAGKISNPILQQLSAKYFAWKVNRKYKRYSQSENARRTLNWYLGKR